VTLCETYMGIEPHLHLWNHFLHTWLLLGSGVEEAVLGGMEIRVKSGHGVIPYFHLPMSRSVDGWRKVWFFLRNDADAPLPVFTGSHPVPQPNWGYGVARRYLRRLQPLCEVVQQLWREGLTGTDFLWTFFSRRVQPLRHRATTM
jgi:hypothetical protein